MIKFLCKIYHKRSFQKVFRIMKKNPLELLTDDTEQLNILSLKSKLMMVIIKNIRDNKWKQREAAEILKVDQAQISKLMNGRISRITIDMLFLMVGRLKYCIDIDMDLSNASSPSIVICLSKKT